MATDVTPEQAIGTFLLDIASLLQQREKLLVALEDSMGDPSIPVSVNTHHEPAIRDVMSRLVTNRREAKEAARTLRASLFDTLSDTEKRAKEALDLLQ